MKLSTMRLTVLGLTWVLLAGASPLTWAADWAAVGLFDQGTFYIDRDSIAREGEARKVWAMLDYRQPQHNSHGKTYRSTRSLQHIQCKTHQVKTLSLAFYAGARGSGDVLSSEGVIQDWQPIPPDSVVAKMARTVCGT
ncbi:MAG: surface-adhesin E family protein [Limnohabitans sp.]|jgi:hypothetical protein